MSRRRGCLLVAAVAAVLLLGAAVAAYRALNPEALRGAAERQLTALVGEPVTIGRMSVSLFPVPAVTGKDVRVVSARPDHAQAVSVGAVRILPQWRTLLSRPVVIDAVEIERLAVTVRRDRERRWILPGPPTTARSPGGGSLGGVPGLPGGGASEALAVRRVRLRDGRIVVADDVLRTPAGSPEVAAISGIEADLVQHPNGVSTLTMRALLGRSALTGTVETGPQGLSATLQSPALGNEDLPALFALLGSPAPASLTIAGDAPLDLAMRVARDTGALTASGQLRAARVQLGTLTVTRFAAPFRLVANGLIVEPLAFTAYSGAARGRLEVQPGRTPASWALDMRLAGIDVDGFLSANTTGGGRLLATGQVVARVRGTADLPIDRHMSGTVDVVLSQGVIRNFALLAAINHALHLTGGDASDTRFERLSATLELARGAIRTDNAALVAGELTASAAGAISAVRTIDMTGTAVFSREASARMIASVKEISGAKNARGEVEVPFRITGPIEAPVFGIDTAQILGRAIQKEIQRNIKKGLDRLFRP